MFNKIVEAAKAMWAEKREACYIAIGYILFMLVFYFIGITRARFDAFVAIALLTGFYALVVWFIRKIDD